MNYKLLFILSAYFVVESNPVIVKMDDYVVGPVPNVGKQLSTFVSVVNSAILGEAVVQKLTTFGEIGVNLMLMQNMPAGEDWISTVNPNDIVMEKSEDLRKILEDGFDKELSIDALKSVMTIEEGIRSLDALSNASVTIQQAVLHTRLPSFNYNSTINALQLFEFLQKSVPILSRLSTDPAQLDDLKIGIQVLANLSLINAEEMRASYDSCKTSISSNECISGFAVLRNISFEKVSIEKTESVAALLDFINYSNEFATLYTLVYQKNNIIDMYKNLNEFQNSIGVSQNFTLLQEINSKMFSSLNGLKVEMENLKKIDGALEIIRPVSEAVAKMHNNYRNNPQKRIKKDNEHHSVFDSFQGLPEGIITLNKLSEITQHSRSPPDEYRNSKIVERLNFINEFSKQRLSILKFSKGVKSTQYVSSIIRNINSLFSQVSEFTTFENIFKNMLKHHEDLASIENIPSGIIALEAVASQIIGSLDKTQLLAATGYTSAKTPSHKKELKDLFSPLVRVIKSAHEIDSLIRKNGKADEKIFSEAFAAAEQLSTAINRNTGKLNPPTDDDIEFLNEMISQIDFNKFKLNSLKLPIDTIVNGLKIAEAADKKIKDVVSSISNPSELTTSFSTSLTKLKTLNTELPARPNQNEIDDFKPLVTELNSLEPLKFTSQLKTAKKSPHITVLMKGTPYGTDILGKLSKEVNDYLRLIKGVLSIQDFKNQTIVASIKELLVGFNAIQVVDNKDKLSAFDILYDSKVIDNRMSKLKNYLDTTYENILTKHLKSTIVEKAHLSIAHSFLNKLNQPLLASIGSLRHDVMWVLRALEHAVDEDKVSTSTPHSNVITEKKEVVPQWMYNAVYFFSFTGVIGFIGNIIMIRIFINQKRRRNNDSIDMETSEISESSSPGTTPNGS